MIVLLLSGCQRTQKVADVNQPDEITAYIENVMKVHEIPGLALAILRKDSIIHKGYYGKASLELDVAVNENHLFRVYSTTKLWVATAIFQLREQGKLGLDDTLEAHLENTPEAWKGVSIANLLTHSSGIPNFIQFESHLSNEAVWSKLVELPMEFEPGTLWRYNQTNYWLLAKIIEKQSGMTLTEFVAQNQFEGDDNGFIFSSNSLEVIPNRISKYVFDDALGKYQKSTDKEQSRGLAGNGLNITLDKFISWNRRLDQNQILSKENKAKMWTSQQFENGKRFAYGWDDYSFDNVMSFGFTGGGVSAFRKFVDHDITVIVLTNGYKYAPIHNTIVNEVVGCLDEDLKDKTRSLHDKVFEIFISKPFNEALKSFGSLRKDHPSESFEGVLNRIGYTLLGQKETKKAIDIFILNTEKYPESANTFDSLGEAFLVSGNLEAALEQYQKALLLNPESTHAQKMIYGIRRELQSTQ
ncbi:MAG: serine hydrolase [Bacteroidota bacterium]